jgi:hypothetical protein
MAQATPNNMNEYMARFHHNEKIEGRGIGNVYTHTPCPFCAAADWLVFEVLQVEEKVSEGATCRECGRSARGLFYRRGHTTEFEMVQTGGTDAPPWLEPKIKRAQPVGGGG